MSLYPLFVTTQLPFADYQSHQGGSVSPPSSINNSWKSLPSWWQGFFYPASSSCFLKFSHFKNSSTSFAVLDSDPAGTSLQRLSKVPWFLFQGSTLEAKRQRVCLNQLEGSFSRVELTYGYWTEGETHPACFWSVWVILFVLPYGTTPLCPYFKSFFFFLFFRTGIVRKRRGDIQIWRFNYLHMLRT